MRARPVSAAALAVAAVLTIAACSDDDADPGVITVPEDDTSTSSSETTTTTEPKTVSPDINPQDVSLIDEAYVQGVLRELEEVDLRNLEEVRDEGVTTLDVIERVKATSTPEREANEINTLNEIASAGFDRYREKMKPVTYEVRSVLTATRGCVSATAVVNASGLFTEPTEPARVIVHLVAVTAEQYSSGLNPTAWAIGDLLVPDEGDSEVFDPCA